MATSRSRLASLVCTSTLLALAGCGGGGKSGEVGSIGGTVQGLTASGLRLQLELGGGASSFSLDVSANATAFTFDQQLVQGTHYSVTILAQPSGLTCTVSSGEGDMGSSPVRTISVFCASGSHLVGGTVTGLGGGEQVVLQLNGTSKSVAANGAYAFDGPIPLGGSYLVTVKTAPAGKGCTVANASGTMGDAEVSNVDVACSPLVPAKPVLAVAAGLKQLRFSWDPPSLATFYRLYEDPDGSGFVQRGGDLTTTRYDLDVSVHRHDWVDARYRVDACNSQGCVPSDAIAADEMLAAIGYFKASNPDRTDYFGTAVSMSADGNTFAVGATGEDSSAATSPMDNLASASGAVYVFVRSGGVWTQQAYLKASSIGADDGFGSALALSADGNAIAVGAAGEDSNATGIGGSQTDNSAAGAGAVYVFVRSGSTWSQQAYVKASNTEAGDAFGSSVALNGDGSTLAVGAPYEDSAAKVIGGAQTNGSATTDSGAVYVFTRTGSTWTQQAYVKPFNTTAQDHFGGSVALSSDGGTLAVGAKDEDGIATGVGGPDDDKGHENGAAYVFTRSGSTWSQQAYVKASNTDWGDEFGGQVTLSGDGNTLAVGAIGESSTATGIGGDQSINALNSAGAVYVFTRSGTTWSQQAYVKASNTSQLDYFGRALTLSPDGNTLAVGATGEDGPWQGVGGYQGSGSGTTGAVYVFVRSGSAWSQQAYVKASNVNTGSSSFGSTLALSADGSTLAVGACQEDGTAAGIGGSQAGYLEDTGAVYLY